MPGREERSLFSILLLQILLMHGKKELMRAVHDSDRKEKDRFSRCRDQKENRLGLDHHPQKQPIRAKERKVKRAGGLLTYAGCVEGLQAGC